MVKVPELAFALARGLEIAEDMVVFTCGHCGESVQKPKVEKHYMTKCRNRPYNLSCMDCFKDFLGNDYEAHTKCITEEERYSGKGFVAKEKKGEKKQNVWVEMLQSVLDEQKGAPANVRRIIETVSKHNNTPRKKPKFINFVKNVCGQKTNPNDINQAWDMISVKLSELATLNARPNQNQQKKSDDDETDDKDENGTAENGDADHTEVNLKENGAAQNGDADHMEDTHKENGDIKEKSGKKSKKQRKEEKKRQKYEAELQSAAQEPTGEEEEAQPTKKEKKKKNRAESVSNGDAEELKEEENKIKKRKRQDTVNAVQEVKDAAAENGTTEEVPVSRVSQKKKKIKNAEEEAEESICLHDQNVAKIGELDIRNDKFNWHAIIMSVLEKKGEMPFKRLQKKVLGEYAEATGQEIDDRIAEKFIKKLKSAPNVRVDKNRVFIED